MMETSEETALLIAQSGPLNGQRWAVRGTCLIGRDPSCDITIPDRQVSRHHARLTQTSKGVTLEDLGSKNGTHHNGQVVLEPVLLEDGDIIQIALAQAFVFLSSDATVPLSQTDEYAEAAALAMHTPMGSRRLRLDKRSRRIWIKVKISAKGAPGQADSGAGASQYREVEVLPPLSAPQYRLLELLYDRQGQVVSRQELAVAVWGEREALAVSEQSLDALVRRLRERLAGVDPHHEYIITLRGHGLRLDNPPL